MHRIAKVISVLENNKFKVVIQRHSMCKKCGACGTSRANEFEVELEAKKNLKLKIGDIVKIELPDNAFLLSVFLVYTFPLITFFVALFISKIFLNDTYSLINGAIFFIISFFIVIKLQHQAKIKKFVNPRIIEVMNNDTCDN